jgi:hypothetical protein
MATGRQFDLPYMVEQWYDTDSRVEELIALIPTQTPHRTETKSFGFSR